MITKKDHSLMQLARKFIRLSNHSRYLVSAVLSKSGRVLSVGVNKEFAAPKQYIKKRRPNLSHHAEVGALHLIQKSISKNSTIYIAGQTVNGTLLLSKPCPTCEAHLLDMQVKRVIYHDKEGVLHELRNY